MENLGQFMNLVVAAGGLMLLIVLREQLHRVMLKGAPAFARARRKRKG